MISLPSVDPSESIATMIWEVLAANPESKASPFPEPSCKTIFASGRSRRATSTVSSDERPSTMTTSSTQSGTPANTCGRFFASFRVGMITLTVASMASVSEIGLYAPALAGCGT
jgi:hypothetical protein